MLKLRKVLIMAMVSISAMAAAQVQTYSLFEEKNKTFSEDDLTSFNLQVFDSVFNMDDYHAPSTSIVASFTTKSVDKLKDYAIVQFIKGCVFEEYKDRDGETKRKYLVRKFFDNKSSIFHHKDWEIDSSDVDPIYNSTDKLDIRTGGYFWINGDKNPLFDDVQEHYFGLETPVIPKLSVQDMPTGGSISYNYSSTVTNSSLEFKICIYKTKDVPLVLPSTQVDFAPPIHCFDWRSSKIFNSDSKKFESIEGIHPFCK